MTTITLNSNQSWASGNNTYTAIAKDVYARSSTNSITVNLQATNGFSYDSNGNLLSDGTRNFAYDDENELISAWVANTWSNNFVYDGKMRRRIERDYGWIGGFWTETNEVHFIYDGNVVVQERSANNLPTVTYTRGNDLSGTLQGAGGIGGMLARTDMVEWIGDSAFATAFYHADGNGNVTCLIYPNGLLAAKYLYDPFGNTLSQYGTLAGANTYRFSSKEWNANSGSYYFLFRFFDPNLQRWLNKDPIEEQGGINQFEYVENDPIINEDLLGLAPPTVGGGMSMFGYLMTGDLGANIQLSSSLIQQASQSLAPALINQLEIVLHNRILKCCQSGSTGIPLSANSQIPIEDTSGSFGFINTGNWQVRAIAHCDWKCGKSTSNDSCSCACTANCTIDVYISKTYTFEPGYNQYNSQLTGVKYGLYPLSIYEQMFWHLNPNPAYFVSAHFQIPYSSSDVKPRCP